MSEPTGYRRVASAVVDLQGAMAVVTWTKDGTVTISAGELPPTMVARMLRQIADRLDPA